MLATLDDERWVQANYKMSTTIHARPLFDKHTAATPDIMQYSIRSRTMNLDDAIAKFTEISTINGTRVLSKSPVTMGTIQIFSVTTLRKGTELPSSLGNSSIISKYTPVNYA